HTPQSIITPYGPMIHLAKLAPSTHFWAYGLGWRMNDYLGRKMVWHTGGIVGFLAYVGMVPEENLGIVVLTNGDIGYELIPQSMAYWIVDRQIGAPNRDWSAELLTAMQGERERNRQAARQLESSRVPGTTPSHPLPAYAGVYTNEIYG